MPIFALSTSILHWLVEMGFYHLGFVYIPISFIGSMINIISFYCLLKYRARSILGFRNQERLLMALNISDFLQCAFIMPWKAITYITQPGLKTKPMSLLYFDCIFFLSSSWIILCIAVNNYIKISRPSQYDQILSKGRLIVLMATTQVFSIGSPALLFVNLYIGIVVNGLTFLLFLNIAENIAPSKWNACSKFSSLKIQQSKHDDERYCPHWHRNREEIGEYESKL